MALFRHAGCPVQKSGNIETEECRRHKAEQRNHGIPSADISWVREDLSKSIVARHFLQAGARVGDRYKLLSSMIPLGLHHQVPKMSEERHHLDRTAGLAGHEKECPRWRNGLRDLSNPTRNGGIKDPQTREAFLRSKQSTEDFRPKTAASHSQ